MHRLIRTEAAAGSLVEADGDTWVVLGPSEWPGEVECRTAERCQECGEPWGSLIAGRFCAACYDAQDGSDSETRNAIEELIDAGLWEEEPDTPPEIRALRERVQRANNDLLTDYHFRYGNLLDGAEDTNYCSVCEDEWTGSDSECFNCSVLGAVEDKERWAAAV